MIPTTRSQQSSAEHKKKKMSHQDLETVKAIIRALLIADKRPLPVRRFLSEYRNNEGHELPWTKFGFPGALSFLRSITDTVHVFQSCGENYIQATVTEDVQHVQKLVSHQKDSGSSRQVRAPQAPRFCRRQLVPGTVCAKLPITTALPMYVPQLIKNNIYELVSTYSNGIDVHELEEAYLKRYATQLRYRACGFRTLEEFVASLSDILSATRSSTGRVKMHCKNAPASHIGHNTLVLATQRKDSPVGECAAPLWTPQPLPGAQPVQTTPTFAFRPTACAKPRTEPMPVKPSAPSLELSSLPSSKPFSGTRDVHVGSGRPSSRGSSVVPESLQNGGGTPVYGAERVLPQSVLDEIKKVLRKHPEGIWLVEFMQTFQHLQPSDYGFVGILELLERYPDVFVVNRPLQEGDFLVCLTPQEAKASAGDEPLGPFLPPDVVVTLGNQVRSAGPEGLTLDQLLRGYEESHGAPLSLPEHGFTRFAFVLYLTAHLPLFFLSQGKRQFVLRWVGPTKDEEQPKKLADDDTCSAACSLSPRVPPGFATAVPSPQRIVPEVLVPSSPFVQQEGLSKYDYSPVYVSQVFSPHHFYIQRKGNDTSVQLEALMDELEKVYDGHYSDRYGLEDNQVHEGFPCAAPYTYKDGTKDWHRAQVTLLCPDGLSCQVLYVDYGTVGTVLKTELRKLRNHFFRLPAQAIHAKLSHIKPASKAGWTEEATKRFLELTSGDRTLMCQVMEKEGNTFPIFLCDTTTVPERHISDILVEERHAAPVYLDEDGEAEEEEEPAQVGGNTSVYVPPEFPTQTLSPVHMEDVEEDFMSVLRRELNSPLSPRAVKPEYLKTGHSIMVVNYNGRPYLSSANVSALLGFPSDRVLHMLETKEIGFPTVTLYKEQNVNLFNQMASYDVPGVKHKEFLLPQLTLFPLSSVNDLLNLFECPSKKLRQEVTAIINSFDPHSLYWQNVSDDSDTEDVTSLEQQLLDLKCEKMELCDLMMRSSSSVERVDKLRKIEEGIDTLELMLFRKDQRISPEGSQDILDTSFACSSNNNW